MMMLLVDLNENYVHDQLMEEIDDLSYNLDDDGKLMVDNNLKNLIANNLQLQLNYVVYVDDVA